MIFPKCGNDYFFAKNRKTLLCKPFSLWGEGFEVLKGFPIRLIKTGLIQWISFSFIVLLSVLVHHKITNHTF